MNSFLKQLNIELRLYARQPLYLLFSLVMPVASFYFFGSMYSNMKYGGIDFFTVYIPSFCMLILFSSSVFSVGNQVVADKEKGIYKRIRVTPISLIRFISVILLKASIVAIIGFLLIILVAKFVFGVAIGIEKLPFMGIYILFTVFSLGIGVLLALIIKKVNTYTMVMMTLFFPMFFLSDATIPLSTMPKWMRFLAEFNPLYHANKILRFFWNEKFREIYSNSLWKSFVFLGIIILVLFLVLLFRWRKSYDKF
ncbi:ABC transporter permease [Lactobacillus sp. DCY120]|uniref:Transport permease protein n=1 Tax=Bombilactobacillus apium TaxID=2675299 RepID=A0A850QZR7_9LACO|nr:ABC transporter permease [Bombilactobacillus apium]NVY96183.1 ABC transporter permease [Bombilactobacillus apium]